MIYRFGDYEVDTNLLELRRAGSARAMDPLGFDLLVYLIENRDRVLTRDELLNALWPGKVVTDSALSSRLKAVRRAVGDTGTAQQIIKTVHGRGYRFIADLYKDNEVKEAASDSVEFGLPGLGKTAAIGRDTELGKLSRWLDRATQGDRAVVFISGEAGVGKTTLTRAFLNLARAQAGAFVLHGQCVNQRGSSEAYLPLLEALGRAGQQDPAVRKLIEDQAPAWMANLPALARDSDREARGTLYGVTSARMLREMADLLNSLATDRVVIMAIEDLHWSDPSTTDWIEYYTRRNDPARLVLITTLRPESSCLGICRELATRGYAHHLALDSIEETYIGDYMANRLDHQPTPDLADLTFRRTEGFPLFIDTLVDHWLQQGLIHRADDGRWAAAADEDALISDVPENLAQLIELQLLGLKSEQLELLETAALAGTPFAAESVACALDKPEEEVDSMLAHEARLDRIVRNAGDVRWPDGTVTSIYEFRHDLFRASLRDRVAASRRVRIHRAFAERLERAYGEKPGPMAGEISDHFARAQEFDRALRYFYPAALQTFNRSAYREAVAIVDRALALLKNVPESDEMRRIERDLQLLRASACIILEGWSSDRVEESYARAQELADSLGLIANAPETFGMAAMHENRGQYAESQAVIESLIERSSDVGLEAHELLACSLFHQGRFEQSISNADRAMERFDPDEVSAILARYGENPGVACHNWAALSLHFTGLPESAIKRSDMALQLGTGHAYSTCSALTLRTHLHQFRNEPEETIRWAERTRAVADEQGFAYRIAQILILDGWARGRMESDPTSQEDALRAVEDGIRRHSEMGSEMDLPHHLTVKSDLLARMGRLDEALEAQERAIESNPGDRAFFYEAEMLRHYAVLLITCDKSNQSRADELLERSLAIARRQGAKLLELKTCITRCQLADESDQTKQQDLEAVLAALEEGHDTPDWRAARACID